ncbi:MAG: EsaB/YukD family protein [Clostridia bacterium]|nr:EsaB/YukD family protein [Clostridia bacterium]
MIMVDVQVPALDASYDFSLSEHVRVSELIEEIAEMICQRERLRAPRDMEGFTLCAPGTGAVLPKGLTLSECGVTTGSKLMLL